MLPEIAITHHAKYVHLVVQTPLVDERFLGDLIESIARALPDISRRAYRLLLEVRAPEARIDLIAAFEAWRQASDRGLGHTQIAYVVQGRPIHSIARLIEVFSKARRVQLRFFEDHASAVGWLCPKTLA
jgi:hypothetical protein